MHYLVFLGMPFTLFGTIIYIISMRKGKAKPNRITRLLWAVANLISAGAAFASGITWAVIPTLVGGISCLIVVIVSFFIKQAYRKLGVFDYICGICALLALGLRVITKQAEIAILFSIISDFFVCIPTYKKSRKYPETENVMPYITGLINPASTFFAVKYFSFTEIAFPLRMLISNFVFILFILRGKLSKKSDKK